MPAEFILANDLCFLQINHWRAIAISHQQQVLSKEATSKYLAGGGGSAQMKNTRYRVWHCFLLAYMLMILSIRDFSRILLFPKRHKAPSLPIG
jgi:hypothetical protein